ncbi:N-acyl-D-amino-acid deacylase family protein [Phenylobacterium montanum]|uniref:Amidohydrolase family protein n=1 Tax=Phenylobacterium montanum TaxID=2823693 RepID=A0A975IW85_9CAUL|nr:amidohydrolase family protein [Caulobacter sp. S6]QUD89565.1 amidohydrolase family protein [Caulobacter sp. S6]
MAEFDLVVRGGRVADGRGGEPYVADIGIKDGVFTTIGANLTKGEAEIDAANRLVTPGFVDIHTHYDGQATWDSYLAPSSWHGVTTAVMGNCGVGFAPVRPEDRDRLVEVMEGVEDIPGAALHEGLAWNWTGFPDYLDALERRPHDIDIAAQLPHAALRIFVMGERGARLEMATDDDIAQMRRLAREAMEAGALGFTTSRTLNHRTKRGDPTPSLRAAEAELTGILQGLDDASAGVFEMISDFDSPGPDAEFGIVRRLAQRFARPTTLSLAQVHHDPAAWKILLGLIGAAADNGLPIKGQVAPRPIGTLLGLQASLNPFSAHPSFRSLAALPFAEKVAALRQPEFRARLFSERPVGRAAEAVARFSDFERIFPLGSPPKYEPAPESSIAATARATGRQVLEIALDLMLEEEGRGFLFAPFSNFADRNLEACRAMLDSPHTLVGLGDGGAHVGMISDASFPTFLLSYWGRDRPTGRFDLAHLVRMQTLDTARAVGLLDRGCIAPGYKADLNVIDFDNLTLQAPIMVDDLPAGGRRLLQRAQGYDATVKSGVVTYLKGEATGALPGRLVRGAQKAPGL